MRPLFRLNTQVVSVSSMYKKYCDKCGRELVKNDDGFSIDLFKYGGTKGVIKTLHLCDACFEKTGLKV